MALKKNPGLEYRAQTSRTETVKYTIPAKPRECRNVTTQVPQYRTVIERFVDDDGVEHTVIIQLLTGYKTETTRVCTEAAPSRTETQSYTIVNPAGYYPVADASWNAEARSISRLTGDGDYFFTVQDTSTGVISGLTTDWERAPSTNIPWAFLFDNGAYAVYERGIERTVRAPFTSSDVFKITRTGTTITYLVNDVLVYTSTNAVSGDLYADAAFYLSEDAILTHEMQGTFTDTHDTDAEVYGTGEGASVSAFASNSDSILPDGTTPLSTYATVYGTGEGASLSAHSYSELAAPAGAWVQGTGGGAIVDAFAYSIHPANIYGTGEGAQLFAVAGNEGSDFAPLYADVYGTGEGASVDAYAWRNPFEGEWPDDGEAHSAALFTAPFAEIRGRFVIDAVELRQEAPFPTLAAYAAATAALAAPFATLQGSFTIDAVARLAQTAPFPSVQGRFSIGSLLRLEQSAPFPSIEAYAAAIADLAAPFAAVQGTYAIGQVARLVQSAPMATINARYTLGVVYRLEQVAPFAELAPWARLEQPAPFALVQGQFSLDGTPVSYSYAMNLSNQAVTRYADWSMTRYGRLNELELAVQDGAAIEISGVDDDGTIIAAVAEFSPIITNLVTRLAALYLTARSGDLVVDVTHGEDQVDRYESPDAERQGLHRRRIKTRRGYKDTLWSVTLRNKDGGPLEVGSVTAALEETTRRYG